MIKRFLLALLCAAGMHAATVTATITYTFTTAVACSASVTTNCMQFFEFGTVSSTGIFSILGQIPLPATLSGTITLPGASFPFNGTYGAIQFGASVAYKDFNGNSLVVAPPFAPPTANANVSPAQVSGLAVVVGP